MKMPGHDDVVARLRRSSVQISDRGGGGSGVVWDHRGTIVTNAHVLRGSAPVVVDAAGRNLRARIARTDEKSDLAVLKTDAAGLEPASIGPSGSLRVGQIVLAVGNPLGVKGAVAVGMIHSIGPLRLGPRSNWIQADVRLAPGNSGGMLADAEGRVIGINTMIFHGLGLAVPSDEVRDFVAGRGQAVHMGVELIPVRGGLMVVGMEPGSAAERAGVSIGDVVRCTPHELRRLLSEVRENGSADIPALRAGKPAMLRVHLRATAAQGARAA
jgi:serine protease Do